MFSFFKKTNFDVVNVKLQKTDLVEVDNQFQLQLNQNQVISNQLKINKDFNDILSNNLNINKNNINFNIVAELKFKNSYYENIDNKVFIKKTKELSFYRIRYFIISDDEIFKNVRITLIDENKQFHIIIDSNTFDDLISTYEYKGKKTFINYENDISNDVYFNNNEYIKKYINMITFSPIKYHRFLQLINKNTIEK